MMAALDHPHVVPVYDYVEHEDLCLLVLECLPGGTVENRFVTAGFEATAALAVALSCAAGLDAAHRSGILHRDVKPSNLMFAANGTLKLTDFGIAKIVGGEETLVTRAGEIIGTPSYIAPEQVRGHQLSPATDVYALATMLYQLLSGYSRFPPAPTRWPCSSPMPTANRSRSPRSRPSSRSPSPTPSCAAWPATPPNATTRPKPSASPSPNPPRTCGARIGLHPWVFR